MAKFYKTFITLLALTVTLAANGQKRDIAGPFTEKNIYDSGYLLSANAPLQQFDLDKKGNIYYAGVAKNPAFYKVVIDKIVPNKKTHKGTKVDSMVLYYAGHPTGMSVEDAKDGTYIWMGVYASKQITPKKSFYKEYWDTQAIGRFKYQGGKTLMPEDLSIEYFYVGNIGSVNVSIDQAHDILAVSFHRLEFKGETRRIRMYRLSEAKALPLKQIQLAPRTFGGDGAPDSLQQTKTTSIMAHDLRSLAPIAEIGTKTNPKDSTELCYYPWQGFDVKNGKIYFIEGLGSYKGSYSCLTIFDFNGNIVMPRTFIPIVQDRQTLKELGLTKDGYVEAEGVKIWKGHLYLGITTRQHGEFHKANVFKY